MRTFKLLISLALLLPLFVGCGKKSSNSDTPVAASPSPNPSPLLVPNPILPPGTNGIDGAVSFSPVDLQTFNEYVFLHPLNNPTNFKLSVSLKDAGSGRYSGTVNIMYTDNGQNYKGTFTAPEGVNSNYPSYDTSRDVGVMKSGYNYWFNYQGQNVFSGFFQDAYGAIVLVIENSVNQGDGQGGGYVSGSVWFKNFAVAFAPQSSERNCWFVYTGPYICRSDIVINKSGLYPTDTFKKLGTFSGLVKAKAFQ